MSCSIATCPSHSHMSKRAVSNLYGPIVARKKTPMQYVPFPAPTSRSLSLYIHVEGSIPMSTLQSPFTALPLLLSMSCVPLRDTFTHIHKYPAVNTPLPSSCLSRILTYTQNTAPPALPKSLSHGSASLARV